MATRRSAPPPDSPSPEPPERTRFTAAGRAGASLGTEAAVYGDGIPDEGRLRLLGPLDGRRVLDLGCGAGHASVAFARQGAKVIAVDADAAQLELARRAAEAAGVKVELQRATGLAELAFVRADAIDAVFSSYALAEVSDLPRVFRQVHRVLKPEHAFAFSLPHPARLMLSTGTAEPRVVRGYADEEPITWVRDGEEVEDHPRTVAAVFRALLNTGFRVDTLLEPIPTGAPAGSLDAVVPATVVFRARKQGS
ncbi:MAG: class I SAM-dependent methyltransferase [Actinobacteria bacterium]|nr:class I SAM-dependent methyltransferase [Actinomycetota bacterium]